jgi:hypothetical protein
MIATSIFRTRAALIVVVATLAPVACVPESSSGAAQPLGGQGACSPNVVVTTNADSGPGSLRQAIVDVCPGGTITFDMNQVVSPITLTSAPLITTQGLIINGPGAAQLAVSANDHSAVFQTTVASPGVVTLSGLSLTQGNSSSGGGGISNNGSGTLNITASIVSQNRTEMRGGGISNNGAGIVNVNDSTLYQNSCQAGGCGVFNASTGTVNVTNSTLNGNGAFSFGSRGGGILNSSTGTVNITNSTLSNNNANTGAGILNDSTGTVNITNSTISHNFATGASTFRPYRLLQPSLEPPSFGGGLSNFSTGPFRLRNSIVALNVASPGGADVDGAFTTLGHNLIGHNAGSTGFTPGMNGDLVGTGSSAIDPRLGPLADNGGPTLTRMLQDDSPARDAGDNSAIANPPFPGPPFTDQRGPGFPRILNNTVDIGSFEATPLPTPTPTPTPTATPTPSPTATPSPSPAKALNISTRLRVETGDEVMIGGFIITGNASKPVVLRGLAPSLLAVGLSDVLADPVLELRGSNGALIMRNDNWKDDQRPLIEGTIFQPTDDRESVIVATLTPGLYTAVLSGKAQTTGIGLVEVYDNGGTADSQLANISTRGFVQTGDKVMIGGFILGGGANTRVAIRGIGPSLSQFGLSNFLADPTLELRNSNGALLAANDNWQDDPEQAAELTASGFGLHDPRESGIFSSPPPGAYTAILAGKNGGIGLGLTEIYNLQ